MKIIYCNEQDRKFNSFTKKYPFATKVKVNDGKKDTIADLAEYHKLFEDFDGGEALFVVAVDPYWLVTDQQAAMLAELVLT